MVVNSSKTNMLNKIKETMTLHNIVANTIYCPIRISMILIMQYILKMALHNQKLLIQLYYVSIN